MDGNGRWANKRSHSRVWGHVRGSAVVSEIVEEAKHLGVKSLTMYAFSSENWNRPQTEVSVLFKLLYKFLKRERARILKNNIRFKIMGDISNLPGQTKDLIGALESETCENTGLKLTFAFGYGGRFEIVNAVNAFILSNPGRAIDEQGISDFMMVPEIGDVDLLIRTGGDQRVSNFMLWQIAYAEMFFTTTKWPDFTAAEFGNILKEVSKRERRFGTVSPDQKLKTTNKTRRVDQGTLRD